MRATIKCKDGQPSHLHISKDGAAVELTPGEALLAARFLQELRDNRPTQDKTEDQARA